MCMRVINADESTKLIGRPACTTHRRILVPIAQGEIPKVSLAVYVGTNKFRMDKRGERVIERNPLAPLPCSQHGQVEMLASTGLGLSKTATILWVKLLKNFAEREVTADMTMREVDGAVMTEMMTSDWSLTEMMGVEIASPCKNKKESTHWLICQPIADAENLHWGALKRDALGVWKTESNVYCIVPVGYQDVIFDELDGSDFESEKLKFFEDNATTFREACQQELDILSDEERQRKDILPDLISKAKKISSQYSRTLHEFQRFSDVAPPELSFDEENEDFICDGESKRLTVRTLAEFEESLKQLQWQVTEFKSQLQRVDGFRELLRGLRYDITVIDCYGILNQTAGLSRFRKNVAVELKETEAVITVLGVDGGVKSQKHFMYAESRSASDFNEELENLGLKEKDDYDIVEAPALKNNGFFKKFFAGCLARA